MARALSGLDEVAEVLRRATCVAVLGAHPDASRPASYVPAYLRSVGYRVIPVNPRYAGETLFGERVRARLDEVREPVDIVDVFRRAEDLPGHMEELLAMAPRPRLVWLQLGIQNAAVAAQLLAAGIDVVQDRCTLADHKRLGLPARPGAHDVD